MVPIHAREKTISLLFSITLKSATITTDHSLLLLPRRRLSSSQPPLLSPPPPPPPKLVDFLISSCGFSPDKATNLSKNLAGRKLPDDASPLFLFLKDHGFEAAQIRALISRKPALLRSNPSKTLSPNLLALQSLNLSSSTLTQLLVSNPGVLYLRPALPRIAFWRDFLNGDEASLLKVFKRNRNLESHDISKLITPRIAFLREYGFSDHAIRKMALMYPHFMTRTIPMMENLMKRTEDLGFQRGSDMFLYGLHVMNCVGSEMLEKKMGLLKSLGWSEKELFSALMLAPNVVSLSEKNLRDKFEFLIEKVGLDPSAIASAPVILGLSMEKRLKPRYHVLQVLESKGLLRKRKPSLSPSIFYAPDSTFVAKYIDPHKEKIPELHAFYVGGHSS